MTLLVHRGRYIQRGRGIGSVFMSLFRSLLPAAKTLGTSVLKSSVTKNVLKAAKEAGKDAALSLAADAIAGENVKKSFDRNLQSAREKIGMSLQPQKRTYKRAQPTKKKYTHSQSKLAKRARREKDIFD